MCCPSCSDRTRALCAAAGAIVLIAAGPALAQEAKKIGLRLMVVHASASPGSIDPGAASLHRRLQRDFRYRSLHVMERRRLQLGMSESGSVQLPTGNQLRMRPIRLGPQGLLVQVELEGRLDTQLRLVRRQQVVIGVEDFRDGKLVVSLEPEY